jgi:hypothetical protein
MEHEDSRGAQTFKVTDKRRFAADGSQKPSTQNPTPPLAKQEASAPHEDDSDFAENDHEPFITFANFVVSMATQASMQMGLVQPPPGMPLRKDLAAAQQTIDILDMLKSKTKGNLNPQEQDLLERALHELRLGYVECAKIGKS